MSRQDDSAEHNFDAILCDDPSDRFAHEIYADYLDELGDPQAELIRIQLQLEDMESEVSFRSPLLRGRLLGRQGELFSEHLASWLGSLASTMLVESEIEYDEGTSIPSVRPAEGYRFHFRRGLLRELNIENLQPGVIGELCSTSALRHLTTLTLNMREIGRPQNIRGRDWQTLAESRWLSNLRHLSIEALSGTTGTILEESLQSIKLVLQKTERLETLRIAIPMASIDRDVMPHLDLPITTIQIISPGQIDLDAILSLADPETLTDLAIVPGLPGHSSQSIPGLGYDELERFFNDRKCRSLKRLTLDSSVFGDRDVYRMISNGWLPSLSFLSIARTDLTNEGTRAIANLYRGTHHKLILNTAGTAVNSAGREQLREVGIQVRG